MREAGGRSFSVRCQRFQGRRYAIALNQQDFTDPRAMIALMRSYLQWIPFNLRFYARVRATNFHRTALTAFNPGESFIVFWVI